MNIRDEEGIDTTNSLTNDQYMSEMRESSKVNERGVIRDENDKVLSSISKQSCLSSSRRIGSMANNLSQRTDSNYSDVYRDNIPSS